MPTEDTYSVEGKVMNTTELMTFYSDLKVEFPELSYLEDPFAAAPCKSGSSPMLLPLLGGQSSE